VLAAELGSAPLGAIDTPGEARAWAHEQAGRVRAVGRYRGVAPVALWGEPRRPVAAPGLLGGHPGDFSRPRPARSAVLRRSPRRRPAGEDENDASPGVWMVRLDDPMESAEDPMGLQRPADQATADPDQLGDSLSELPEARMVRSMGSPREVLQGDAEPVARGGEGVGASGDPSGISYPEWDHRVAAYRMPGAVVRPGPASAGSAVWAEGVLARHASLVRHVRRRFEGLRPRRVCVDRQPDGDGLDLAAYVSAFADWRAGEPGEDRLYTSSRPARRELAVVVLADVSASTDAWVDGRLRVVDVEKEALVVLLEALDVLGDRHAVLAFSGEGPDAVRVRTVKGFDEGSRTVAWRRIASLEPDGYTRVGAAVRHASVMLTAERARHRLLLLLSDGKPNDVDAYAGRYGIADTQRAVAEARLQGLTPFCLTVDREAPAYLPAIFGPRGFAVLPRPERLPLVIVEVLRSLVMA